MNVLADGPLNMITFETALRPSRRRVETILNLEGMTFIDIFGLVGLACVAKSPTAPGGVLTVRHPKSARSSTYLARMDFYRFLGDHCGTPRQPPPEVHHNVRDDVLVELQWFNAGDNLSRLDDLLFTRLDGIVPPQMLGLLIECLWEIADNTQRHSEATGGVMAAQVYDRGRQSERINLAIGDVGIGIRKSLASSHKYSPRDDEAAIRLALQFGVSTVDDPGRGVGLPTTAETVRGLGGKMIVRTGRACHTMWPRRSARTTVGHKLEGTLVGMSIPCR